MRLKTFIVCALCWSSLSAQVDYSSVRIELDSPAFASRSGATITQADLDAFLSDMPGHHQAAFLSDPERIGRTTASLLRPRSLAAIAQADGALDSDLVTAKVIHAANTIIANEYIEHLWERQELPDYTQQAYELFLSEPDRFTLGTRVDFTHILIRTTGYRGELAGLRSIISIYDALRDDQSLVLSDLAVEYSEDPSVEQNAGKFTDQALADLDQAVAEVLRRLPEGEISEPVRSAAGWHILQLHRRYAPDVESFDQVRQQAIEIARADHRTKVRETLLKQTSSEPIQYYPGAVQSLLDRYPSAIEDTEKLVKEVMEGIGVP